MANIATFDAAAVHAALPYDRLIPALREGFLQGAEVPVRHHHVVPRPGQYPGVLLLMPAWQPGTVTGVKLVHICAGNERLGVPSVQGVYLLFDGPTGTPLALLDGTALTLRRTAATSALAASFLARPDATRLLVVGAGALGPNLARAHASVRPITEIAVWNRTPARAETVAAELAAEGFDARAEPDLDAALGWADIVTCATMSRDPLVRGDRLRPGTHVDLVGAFAPDMRESDDALMRRAHLVVDARDAALAEAGDILQAIASGAIDADAIRSDLFELVRGTGLGRPSAEAVTVFKSVGNALEDLVAARLVAASQP
ncbi:MAG: ornithine cyclodeaminase family protein [Geminicoccaceae bacterium]